TAGYFHRAGPAARTQLPPCFRPLANSSREAFPAYSVGLRLKEQPDQRRADRLAAALQDTASAGLRLLLGEMLCDTPIRLRTRPLPRWRRRERVMLDRRLSRGRPYRE